MEPGHHLAQTLNSIDRRFSGGLFISRAAAEAAYKVLISKGYVDSDIHVVMSAEARNKFYTNDLPKPEVESDIPEPIGGGAEVGALVGIISAVTTSLLIPGVGLVIGPLAAGLLGAGAGGILGSLIDAFMASGLPESHAKQYEDGIRDGRIFIGFHPDSDADALQIEKIWKDLGGEQVYF